MPEPQNEPQEFADLIREFAHGTTNEIATKRLREVVAACVAVGGKGSITIKLSINAKQGIASVGASISVKKPEPELPGSSYYTTEDGELRDEDPRQLKLPSKVIDAPSKLKTVNFPQGGES